MLLLTAGHLAHASPQARRDRQTILQRPDHLLRLSHVADLHMVTVDATQDLCQQAALTRGPTRQIHLDPHLARPVIYAHHIAAMHAFEAEGLDLLVHQALDIVHHRSTTRLGSVSNRKTMGERQAQ